MNVHVGNLCTFSLKLSRQASRIGEQIVDVPVAQRRGIEVKPAVTHLSESTSSLSMCWCFSQALVCLVLA